LQHQKVGVGKTHHGGIIWGRPWPGWRRKVPFWFGLLRKAVWTGVPVGLQSVGCVRGVAVWGPFGGHSHG